MIKYYLLILATKQYGIEDLKKEASLMSELRHPNIVRCFGISVSKVSLISYKIHML